MLVKQPYMHVCGQIDIYKTDQSNDAHVFFCDILFYFERPYSPEGSASSCSHQTTTTH